LNREAIYAALFTQLSAIPGLVTTSRILKHWTDVPGDLQPALYQAQGREIPLTVTGQPTKWELRPTIYVYVRTDGQTPPSTAMNPILDQVVAIVNKRNPITNTNNLGGIAGVEWARLDGAIETDEGTLGNQAVAIVPVLILVTD
jgi:hypothetical protein